MRQAAQKWTERDLAGAVVRKLEEERWTCYGEVAPYGGRGPRADIAAVLDGRLLHMVECKLTLSVAVVRQALRWTGRAHFVSVAVPRRGELTPDQAFLADILRTNGIGLIGVSMDAYGKIGSAATMKMVRPRLHRSAHRTAEVIISKLRPEMRADTAGGTAGETDFFTPFKMTMRELVKMVKKNPGIPMREAIRRIDHHYSSDQSARASLKTWLDGSRDIDMRQIGRDLCLWPKGEMG
jgi:hypothetical protein